MFFKMIKVDIIRLVTACDVLNMDGLPLVPFCPECLFLFELLLVLGDFAAALEALPSRLILALRRVDGNDRGCGCDSSKGTVAGSNFQYPLGKVRVRRLG